jgi:hypothetical protein
MNEKWSLDWPESPGWYWFYGRRFSGDSIKLLTVRVKKISNGLNYVAGSLFMYKSEGVKGLWLPMKMPELPEGDEDDLSKL